MLSTGRLPFHKRGEKTCFLLYLFVLVYLFDGTKPDPKWNTAPFFFFLSGILNKKLSWQKSNQNREFHRVKTWRSYKNYLSRSESYFYGMGTALFFTKAVGQRSFPWFIYVNIMCLILLCFNFHRANYIRIIFFKIPWPRNTNRENENFPQWDDHQQQKILLMECYKHSIAHILKIVSF